MEAPGETPSRKRPCTLSSRSAVEGAYRDDSGAGWLRRDRPDRAPQRRQVHADECVVGTETQHHLAQAADHATLPSRHPHHPDGPVHPRRYARIPDPASQYAQSRDEPLGSRNARIGRCGGSGRRSEAPRTASSPPAQTASCGPSPPPPPQPPPPPPPPSLSAAPPP